MHNLSDGCGKIGHTRADGREALSHLTSPAECLLLSLPHPILSPPTGTSERRTRVRKWRAAHAILYHPYTRSLSKRRDCYMINIQKFKCRILLRTTNSLGVRSRATCFLAGMVTNLTSVETRGACHAISILRITVIVTSHAAAEERKGQLRT